MAQTTIPPDDFNSRVAVIEQIASTLDRRFDHIEARFDRLDARFDRFETKFDARFDGLNAELWRNFRWTLGIMLGGFAGTLAVMAHGFHWL